MHGMASYFLRRLLLVPVTFVVITFLVYTVLRIAPGGPLEQAEAELKAAALGEAGGGLAELTEGGAVLDETSKEELKRYYNLDRAIPVGYLQWLGVWPRNKRSPVVLEERRREPELWGRVDQLWKAHVAEREGLDELLGESGWVLRAGSFYRPAGDSDRRTAPEFFAEADELRSRGQSARKRLEKHLARRDYLLVGTRYCRLVKSDAPQADARLLARLLSMQKDRDGALRALEETLAPHALEVNSRTGSYYHSRSALSGILQGDFGRSFTYTKPALKVIVGRFYISIYFGLIGYLATWIVCIPLGVYKAIHHRSLFDAGSSTAVFLGYATPGFVACLLLLLLFGGGSYWNLVPLGGFRSDGWEEWWANGEIWRCVKDQLHHTLVPIFGYLVGSFASMTVLMKNSLLENLGTDYVRTAFAKGLPERRVIFVHALRNSLIPITAGIGHFLGLLFAGSFLIEKVCNIPGMGLLGYNAILQRDYPIILATLVFGVLIRLFGNILSDVIWAVIDPRIRFR
ncbi:MAG: ABC transporter permease subunit [Planctomycetota bacterium]